MPTPPLPRAAARACIRALKRAGGNRTRAARHLGLNLSTFNARMRTAQHYGFKVDPSPERAAVGTMEKPRNLERENAQLHARLARVRAARRVRHLPPKPVRRSGKGDRIRVIMPDSHGSCADPLAMAAFIEDLRRLDPDEIVMLGDHVDAGGFLSQHHTIGYVAQTAYSYEDDIEACNQHLDAIQKAAPRARIEYLEGNHEDRVERWCVEQALRGGKDAEFLRKAIAPQFLLKLKERGIPYYRRSEKYDNLNIPGTIKRGKCFYVHDPGHGDPARVLSKWGGSVAFGHIHRNVAVITDIVGAGTVGAWSPGCLAQVQQYWHHSKPTGHTHGYGVELIARSDDFLRLNIPIIEGRSYLSGLLARGTLRGGSGGGSRP